MGIQAAVQEAQLDSEVIGCESSGFSHGFSSFLTFAPSLLNLCFFLFLPFHLPLLGQQPGQPYLRAEPHWTGESNPLICLQRHLDGKAASSQHCRGQPLGRWVLQARPATSPHPCLGLSDLRHTWAAEGITDHREAALCAPQSLPPLLL